MCNSFFSTVDTQFTTRGSFPISHNSRSIMEWSYFKIYTEYNVCTLILYHAACESLTILHEVFVLISQCLEPRHCGKTSHLPFCMSVLISWLSAGRPLFNNFKKYVTCQNWHYMRLAVDNFRNDANWSDNCYFLPRDPWFCINISLT